MKRFFVLFALILAAAALLAVSVSAETGAEQVPEGLYFVDTEWNSEQQRFTISENPYPRTENGWQYRKDMSWHLPLAYFDGSSYTLLSDVSELTYTAPIDWLIENVNHNINFGFSGVGTGTITYQGKYSVQAVAFLPQYGVYPEPYADADALCYDFDASTEGDVFYIVGDQGSAPILSVEAENYSDYYRLESVSDTVWSVTLTDAANGRWGDAFRVYTEYYVSHTNYCNFTRVEPGLYFVNTEWDDAEQRRVVSKNPYPEVYREWEYSSGAWLMTLAYYDGTDYTLLNDCSMLTYSGPVQRLWKNGSDILLAVSGLGRITVTYDGKYSVDIDINYPRYGLYTAPETDASAMFSQYDAGTQGDVFYIVARDDAEPIVSVTANENPDYYQFRKINDRVWSVTLTDAADGSWRDRFRVNIANDWWYTDYCYFTRVKPGLYFVNTVWDAVQQRYVLSENPNPQADKELEYRPDTTWSLSLAYFDGTDYHLLTDSSQLTYSGPVAALLFNNSSGVIRFSGVGTVTLTYDGKYSLEISSVLPRYGLYTEPRADISALFRQYDASQNGDRFYIVVRDDAAPIVSIEASAYSDYYRFEKVSDKVWSVTLTDAASGTWNNQFLLNTEDSWQYTVFYDFTRIAPGLYFVNAEWDNAQQRFVVSKNPYPSVYQEWNYYPDAVRFPSLAYYDGTDYTFLNDCSMLTYSGPVEQLGSNGNEVYLCLSGLGRIIITYDGRYSVEIDVNYPLYGLYTEPRVGADVQIQQYDAGLYGNVFYIVARDDAAPIVSVTANGNPDYYQFQKVNDRVWSVTLTEAADGRWGNNFRVNTANTWWYTNYCDFTRVKPGLYFVNTEWDAAEQRNVVSRYPNPEKYREVRLSSNVLWFNLAYYDGNSYTLLTDSSELTDSADWAVLGDNGYGEIYCTASETGTVTITYQGTDSVELNITLRPFGLYAEPRADISVMSYDFDMDSRGRVFYIVGRSGQAPITSVQAEQRPSYYEFERISDLVWSVTLTDEAAGNWSDDFLVETQNGGYWTGYCYFHSGQVQPGGDHWLDNTDGQQINIFVGKDNRRHIIDGIAAEGEYGEELEIKDNYKTFAAPENVADIVDNPARLWMSTDDEYVYIAAATKADGYHNGCDNNPSNLWGQYGIQISLADTDNDDSSYRLELGYAKSSETGNLLFVNWNDGLGYGYEAVPGEDFQVRVGTDEILYEMRIPFEAFTSKNPEDLHAFRFSIVWATGTSEDDLADQYEHVQLGYGVTGNPGKDVTGHAVIMIEEAPAVFEGDLNCDGTVDIRDVVLLLRNSMFPEDYPIAYQESTDFNGDGSVDVHDAAVLLQYSLFPNLYPLA